MAVCYRYKKLNKKLQNCNRFCAKLYIVICVRKQYKMKLKNKHMLNNVVVITKIVII